MAFPVAGEVRVLAAFMAQTVDNILEGEVRGFGAIEELDDLPDTRAEVKVQSVKYPNADELYGHIQGYKPHRIYINAGIGGERQGLETRPILPLNLISESTQGFVDSVSGLNLDLVYLDASNCASLAQQLIQVGAAHVVYWPQDGRSPLALPASMFARTFFASLRLKSITVPEAYAFAVRMTRAHCALLSQDGNARVELEPPLPQLLTLQQQQQQPALPSNTTVPSPPGLGVPIQSAIPGYSDLRLLAPNAELRMLVAGLTSSMNPHCLGQLCEALRGLLATETRNLTLVKSTSVDRLPSQIPTGSRVIRCDIISTNGYPMTVMLSGPESVLKQHDVVEHALRQTLTADAQSLQFRLPPPDVPLPVMKATASVGGGVPTIEALVSLSVWGIQLCKLICQDVSSRSLVMLGIAAVSNTLTATFKKQDANRLAAIISNNDPAKLIAPAQPVVADLTASASAADVMMVDVQGQQQQQQQPGNIASGSGGGLAAPTPNVFNGLPPRPTPPQAMNLDAAGAMHILQQIVQPHFMVPQTFDGGVQQQQQQQQQQVASPTAGGVNGTTAGSGLKVPMWTSSRPALASCSEQDFLTDLVAFLNERRGKSFDPNNFPEVQLNGVPVDLYNMYVNVCRRGGYRTASNSIDWKDLYSILRNCVGQVSVGGIENVLKRHYQLLLLDYEDANPRDVTRDPRMLAALRSQKLQSVVVPGG